jgi:ribosomal 50S subunit-associated protein YjgA (DUF615 family)
MNADERREHKRGTETKQKKQQMCFVGFAMRATDPDTLRVHLRSSAATL